MKRRPPKIVGCSPEDLALLDEKVVKGTVKNETHGTPVSVSRLTYKPGDSAWGTGLARRESKRQNTKVPSPLRASAPPAGCQRMGHTHAFGSTEEPLRRTVFGCLERAPLSGPRFDHTTGEGHVPFHKGDYHDALRHKNNQVALLLVECFGGIASGGARLLRYLARRASAKKRGRDGTKYSKFHPRG